MRKKNLLLCLLAVLIILSVAACANQTQTTPSPSQQAMATVARPEEIIVSAAASLTDVMTEIADLYKTKAPDVTIKFNVGSSGALQEQIEQGAPADIFMSASKKQMTALEDGGFILDGTKADLLENKIVLVIPAGKDTPVSFEDFRSVEKLAIGEPATVPAGEYADSAGAAKQNCALHR